ncbi:MAG: hypothetical protein K9N21_06130 [Deltaproteobacteria bacterium]|nr:hypothetical protein [Deltaproteobacteria bacterium]
MNAKDGKKKLTNRELSRQGEIAARVHFVPILSELTVHFVSILRGLAPNKKGEDIFPFVNHSLSSIGTFTSLWYKTC